MSSLWNLARDATAKAVNVTRHAGIRAVSATVAAVENVVEATRPLTESKEHKEERERERDVKEKEIHSQRVDEFFNGQLTPFEHEDEEDTKLKKTGRVAQWTLNILEFAGVQYSTAIASLLKVSKYGVAAFIFREDLADLVNVVASFLGSDLKGLSKKDTVVGLYYLMCLRMLERRADPLLEDKIHKEGTQGVIAYEAPEELLKELSWYLPYAFLAYAESKAQVQWMANGYGFELIVSHLPARKLRPAFNLIASKEQKLAILSVCGTKEIGDLATDSKLLPDEFENGHCHQGMLTAAKWLLEQGLLEWITKFSAAGYRIAFCGHSLGAGVVSLAAFMLRKQFPDIHVYAYAPPCVISEELANDPWVTQHIKAFVNRDDIVARASAANASLFAAELRATRGQWEPLLNEDYSAFKARVATLWAPARRHPKKTWEAAERSAPLQHPDGSIPDTAGELAVGKFPIKGVRYNHQVSEEDVVVEEEVVVTPSAPPLEGDESSLGLPNLPLPPSSTEAHNKLSASAEGPHGPKPPRPPPPSAAALAHSTSHATSLTSSSSSTSSLSSSTAAAAASASVTLVPDLPQSFEAAKIRLVPMGLIVHAYAFQGVQKASLVDHTFVDLRRIVLSPHLLENHGKVGIIHAMRTVMAARRAANPPPEWASANADDAAVCKVCHLDVTWASTSSSEAQKARAMHHCRACGKIVCHECSLHKSALPTIGMVEPDRVCDLCYFKGSDLSFMFS